MVLVRRRNWRRYDLAADAPTREAAIERASQQLNVGDQFQIIEARSSDAQKYEGSDFVPFLRTRNHEIVLAFGAILAATVAKP